ncbi:MAG: DUF3445 domain-containing protein [Pseudomonadota bacterium]
MTAPVLHDRIPDDVLEGAFRPLPGTRPLAPDDWLRRDGAYGAQMAARAALLGTRRDQVLAALPDAAAAMSELFRMVCDVLRRDPGYRFCDRDVVCPDGRVVSLTADDPVAILAQLVQCDFCLLDRMPGARQHSLRAAALCFPASWRLSDKIGRPLSTIHAPVSPYDDAMARRVQRLFDGVRAGAGLWRANLLSYADPALFQPRHPGAAKPRPTDGQGFLRSERQTIIRLPKTGTVVFSIHTYQVRVGSVTEDLRGRLEARAGQRRWAESEPRLKAARS